MLRGLLAGYLGTAPEALQFQYGEFRKPALRGGPWFNVSHSGSIALYAFSSVGEIGIDVELVASIDSDRRQGNLSSAIRLFVLAHYRALAGGGGDASTEARGSGGRS